MTQDLNSITTLPNHVKSSSVTLSKLYKLLSIWPFVLISLVTCLVIAWLYLRYTTSIYTIVASILVRDDTKGTDLGESIMIENFGLAKGKSNLDNEIEILKSRTLMENVVKDLHLTVSYYAKEKVKTTEVYNKSPFSLVVIQPSTHVKFEEPWHLEFKEKQKFKFRCILWDFL